jgi:hypothetical protein
MFLVRGLLSPPLQIHLAKECLSAYIDDEHETNLTSGEAALLSATDAAADAAAASREGLWKSHRHLVKTKLRFVGQ